MHVVYANQPPPESWTASIFLAGPTPRERPGETPVPSWRPEALRALELLGYDGVVFVPETEDGIFKHDYNDQIEWEELCLNFADAILFWIPRDLATLPGFTTNDEWGYWKKCDPQKLVLGTPQDAPKTKYQRYYANKLSIPVYDSLTQCCLRAWYMEETVRSGGERCVPLHIWRTPQFQNWYRELKAASNELRSARVEWTYNSISGRPPFFAILHVTIYIAAEDRERDNEVVILRPDTSVALLYHRGATLLETKIVLVEEFRSCVANRAGRVLTLPGGSSLVQSLSPSEVAHEECWEEVSISIPAAHFVSHDARQLDAATLSHKAHLFSYELSSEQLADIEARSSEPLGVPDFQEVTIRKVLTLEEVLNHPHIDWSVLGMITSVLKA